MLSSYSILVLICFADGAGPFELSRCDCLVFAPLNGLFGMPPAFVENPIAEATFRDTADFPVLGGVLRV